MSSPACCPICHATRIPGLATCANCGEPIAPAGRASVLAHIPLPPDGEPLPDGYPTPSADGATIQRALTEARALEYAGDEETAIAIYERLIKTRTYVTVPYQRLAILYRRRKQPADEERVVRLALAHTSCGPSSWFVLRLVKILSEQRRRTRPT